VRAGLSPTPPAGGYRQALNVSVPVCILAIADVMMRKRATDIPSEACLNLLGESVDGTRRDAGYSLALVRMRRAEESVQQGVGAIEPGWFGAVLAGATHLAARDSARAFPGTEHQPHPRCRLL
jgi:hypothetical protein